MAITNGKLGFAPPPTRRRISNRIIGFILWSTITILIVGSAAYIVWYGAHG